MDRFAYLVEEAELADLRPDWPAGVSVALCLDADGDAGLVLFESDDQDGLAARIAASTGWEPGSFAVTPEIEGCPTLRPLFSQAQNFTRMVASFDGIDRMAHRFAGGEEPLAPEPEPRPAPRTASRLTLSLPESEPVLPAGYRSAADLSGDAAFLGAQIRVAKGHVRVVIAPEKVSRRARPVIARHVGFRDDLRCFVLRPDALGAAQPGQGAIIDIPEDRFPAALVSRLKTGADRAEVTVTEDGLFVTPALGAGHAHVARKSSRKALPATLVIGVAMGLLSGSVVTALQDPSSGRPDMLAYRAAPGHSGLNVLASFASSMEREEQVDN